ncbi:response regulator [Piscirickettsia litoralis]|uniref:Response regulatory domain-containing protein n=1 Tax=Piscirickettsia litoralis TaxID=1891921 RepID=A0ABX3A6J5_9GAMM|nr:response regulator [Piscirickettsia litoralis]ODN41729.1 hypothetical protein BGC07_00435 [Piscirickettsia litoralis]
MEISIILAEDNESDAKLLIQALTKKCMATLKIKHAFNGEEALKVMLADHPVDLLITNLYMPRMGGRQLLRDMRDHLQFRKLPAIVLTNSDYNRDMEYCMKLQVNSYLLKPFDLAELNRVIEIINQIIEDILADKSLKDCG